MAISKQMRKQIKEAEAEIDREIHKQVDIYYSAVSIALHRHWNWGRKHIEAVLEETQLAWNECASDNRISMVQMLEDETGIELQNETGKSWRDVCYLNNDHPANNRPMDAFFFYTMREKQKEWIGTQVFACILLGMHRKYGYGTKRLAKVVAQTVAVREEFGFDRDKLLEVCKAECGITIRDKEEDLNNEDSN